MKIKSKLLIFSILGVVTMSCNDSTQPFIALNGSPNHTISLNSVYNEPGAIAIDDEDGDISSAIVITGSVDPDQKGEYHIYYNVADNSGNNASVEIRDVHVVNDADYLEGFYLATPNCGATTQSNYTSTLTSSETVNNKIFIDQLEMGISTIIPGYVSNDSITLASIGTINNYQYTGTGIIFNNGFNLNSIFNYSSNYAVNCATVYTKQ